MSNEFSRRALLRYSALAGAGALTSPLWSGALPASAAAHSRFSAGQYGQADLAADRIVASVRRPRFPGRAFPVTRFGAVGDGTTDCTRAFAAAIAACNRADGRAAMADPDEVSASLESHRRALKARRVRDARDLMRAHGRLDAWPEP